jgi:hypothetical protein
LLRNGRPLSAQSDYRLQRCFATKVLSASAIAPLWLFNRQPVEVAFAGIDQAELLLMTTSRH